MSIASIKRQARRDLHGGMGIAAFYIPTPGATPQPVRVRVHKSTVASGDPDNVGYAEREIRVPRIVFDRLEVPSPSRGAVLTTEEGEAYRLDVPMPPDGEFVSVPVAPLLQTSALPFPEASS